MSATKRYVVNFGDENSVTLEVDTEKLSPELATEINKFWSSHSLRLSEQNNNPVEVVARLFGAAAIRVFMENGGALRLSEGKEREYWTRKVLQDQWEGWPEFESLGVLLVDADVSCVDYFEVTLKEAAQ